ncbi:MAG: 50S ribosomal protein L17 [Bacteroidetes bacterium]|jgi:large subunit ribosomal protein L17|nr:50S ribosomal protein L17 [Bacteroidota bacterium]MCB0604554.1 50S ribosomal protein L17 [Saprospiraceae bacterium]MCO5277129.1 50S ribosomal protein L17 [Saprospiraceae bacterium]HRG43124.1 50S ribosomal protein L17 [Saprospiraceae bacterium]
MRHGNKVNALGRTKSHRDAMLKNMASSLIEHKRINTTLAKAKALRGYLEPLITKSKSNNTHSRRVVFSYLQNKVAVDTLFSDIREKIGDRPGGYLRIIKLGDTRHDNADVAMIEFVDYNTIYNPNESLDGKAKVKTRRSRRKASGVTKEATPAAPVQEEVNVVAEEESNVETAEVEEIVENIVDETTSASESNDESAPETKDEESKEV